MSYENCGSPEQIEHLDSEFESSAANLNKLLDQALNRPRTESSVNEKKTEGATTVRSTFYSENKIKLFPTQTDEASSSKIASIPFIGSGEIGKDVCDQPLVTQFLSQQSSSGSFAQHFDSKEKKSIHPNLHHIVIKHSRFNSSQYNQNESIELQGFKIEEEQEETPHGQKCQNSSCEVSQDKHFYGPNGNKVEDTEAKNFYQSNDPKYNNLNNGQQLQHEEMPLRLEENEKKDYFEVIFRKSTEEALNTINHIDETKNKIQSLEFVDNSKEDGHQHFQNEISQTRPNQKEENSKKVSLHLESNQRESIKSVMGEKTTQTYIGNSEIIMRTVLDIRQSSNTVEQSENKINNELFTPSKNQSPIKYKRQKSTARLFQENIQEYERDIDCLNKFTTQEIIQELHRSPSELDILFYSAKKQYYLSETPSISDCDNPEGDLYEKVVIAKSPLKIEEKEQNLIPLYQQVYEVYDDGAKYEGEKFLGKRHGKGTYYYKEGYKYEGSWDQDIMSGYGVLWLTDELKWYEGEWQNNVFHGRGSLYNLYIEKLDLEKYYVEDFDKIENGWIKYEGQFQEGLKHKFGIILLSNGDSFIGNFKKNKLEGRGSYTKPNKPVIVGQWENNKLKTLY